MLPPKWWISIIKSCSPASVRESTDATVSQATRPVCHGLALMFLLLVWSPPGNAQFTHKPSSVTQLQRWAEEAMTQGDPHGAAIHIGKAALLASRLDRQGLSDTEHPYRIMAGLFRIQENVYRAIALFRQNGADIPASSAVCALLTLGLQHAPRIQGHGDANTTDTTPHHDLRARTEEWLEIAQELQQDWECGP